MKPKKMVDRKPTVSAGDPTKFRPEVFDLIRVKVAPMIGGNINLGVKLTAEFFQPLVPKDVRPEDLTDEMVAKIAAKFRVADRGDRLPLNEEAQEKWDLGRWKGQLTVNGLRQRYDAELKEITTEMADAYASELKAEKVKIDALVAEHDDPDAPADKKFPCGNPGHRGPNEPFMLKTRFLLVRNDGGELERRRHSKFDGGEILAGDLLVLTSADAQEQSIDLTSVEVAEGGRKIPFCEPCRMAALSEARDAGLRVTFYTWAGATAKLVAASKAAAGNAATSSLLKAVGQRRGGFNPTGGPRKAFKGGWRRS